MNNNYIKPNWPAPKNVMAFTTKRVCGSLSLRTGNNSPNEILANRKKLYNELNLPQEPFWLKQEHTATSIHLTQNNAITEPVADSSFATLPNLVCAVMTADCAPILVCDRAGSIVAAIHAGWKGIASGIIESTISAMNTDATRLLAWLGPAIGSNFFEVGNDIYKIFIKINIKNKKAFYNYNNNLFANIYQLASLCLNNAGVTAIYGGEYCTFTQQDIFFSFRRDGTNSGRMASLIWLTESSDAQENQNDH